MNNYSAPIDPRAIVRSSTSQNCPYLSFPILVFYRDSVFSLPYLAPQPSPTGIKMSVLNFSPLMPLHVSSSSLLAAKLYRRIRVMSFENTSGNARPPPPPVNPQSQSQASETAAACLESSPTSRQSSQSQQLSGGLIRPPVRRRLFPEEPIDHQATAAFLKAETEKQMQKDIEKYQFDFRTGLPLSNSLWTPPVVSTCELSHSLPVSSESVISSSSSTASSSTAIVVADIAALPSSTAASTSSSSTQQLASSSSSSSSLASSLSDKHQQMTTSTSQQQTLQQSSLTSKSPLTFPLSGRLQAKYRVALDSLDMLHTFIYGKSCKQQMHS